MKKKLIDFNKTRKNSLNNLKKNRNRSSRRRSLNNILINSIFINSFFYQLILRLFGLKLGKNVIFHSPINFIIDGQIKNIEIDDNVSFGSNVTLKIRENGKIKLKNKVYIDDNVRLVAARDGFISIGEGTEIGANSILNSGGKMTIGSYCLISNNCNINSSTHDTKKSKYIMDQKHIHGETIIKDDVWLGGFVTVTANSKIGEGSVIGANSLVNSEIKEFTVNVGSPTKIVRKR